MKTQTCRNNAAAAARRRAAGFTLLEMLVVMMIIGLLVSMVGPRLFSKVDTARVQTATAQIKLLRGAVETMRLDIHVYPTAEQGLKLLVDPPSDPALRQKWKGPYLEEAVPPDPWGNPYLYEPGDSSAGKRFVIYSYGADGKPGGVGDAQDIGRDAPAPDGGTGAS
jgi:general secretion pathway protein G